MLIGAMRLRKKGRRVADKQSKVYENKTEIR